MTQEEKELILKDLCAMLPYGAFVQFEVDGQKTIKPLTVDFFSSTWYHTEFIKPYLRPMSSMSEEERNVYNRFKYIKYHEWDGHSKYTEYVEVDEINDYFDWLNSHHFDYRGLIHMGLAIEAPKDMYTL